MQTPQHLEIRGDIARYRASGECTLVEAVDRIAGAIASCRDRGIGKLLVDTTGLVGVPVPSLVDRFLMVEEWAREGEGKVVLALVVRPEYIHPEKFGIHVAAHFGMLADVYTDEADALEWLSRAVDRE